MPTKAQPKAKAAAGKPKAGAGRASPSPLKAAGSLALGSGGGAPAPKAQARGAAKMGAAKAKPPVIEELEAPSVAAAAPPGASSASQEVALPPPEAAAAHSAPASARVAKPVGKTADEPAGQLAPGQESKPTEHSEGKLVEESAEEAKDQATGKPPELTPAARTRQLQEDAADPWAGVGEEDALAKISEETWEVLSFDDDLGDDQQGVSAAHIVAKDGGRESIVAGLEMQRRVVSLDLAENLIARVDLLPALWIRNLVLSSNPLASLDHLGELFPRLLSLDLSYVEIPDIEGAWVALAACASLRILVAEGAGVSSFEVMASMPQLRGLELLENGVEELEEIATLAARCPNLQRLDMRENPVASEAGYARAVKKHLPGLVWHNNQSQKKYVAVGRDKIKYGSLDAEINAVDGLYKNEGCSCLEGNPCLTPETCVDWANREAVAAEARKRKGLRDDAGKQL